MEVLDFQLDQHAEAPLYRQISDHIRQHIATGRLKPGDHLPAVRQLARSLGVNQNTVVKAYSELEQQRVIVSRRGGGTIVARSGDDPSIIATRQRHLSDIISDDIVKVLSLGYSPEEAEAAFYLHLSRWREERQVITAKPEETPVKPIKRRNPYRRQSRPGLEYSGRPFKKTQ
jgi:GntR family transcriptional regulator